MATGLGTLQARAMENNRVGAWRLLSSFAASSHAPMHSVSSASSPGTVSLHASKRDACTWG